MTDTITSSQDTLRDEIASLIASNVATEVWGAPLLHGDETTRFADGIDRAADAVVAHLSARA
ncbi:hypothetical protein [Luteimicrobium subarcticum]|uniref:Uncharacterized protein n=1 Tax=Luteimicrobium subarcticum TaxID=620910 RepID=A0A2M8W6R2_9MICO|nr:hypothetical protein [Luteimicrobium subarcticum]PJI86620.1 hypothetical protein CLV34_2540 [Luteimicrobium subarcticum]